MALLRFLSVEKSLFSDEPITIAWLLSIGAEQLAMAQSDDFDEVWYEQEFRFTDENSEFLLSMNPPAVFSSPGGCRHDGIWTAAFDENADYLVPDDFHVRKQVARFLWARGYKFPGSLGDNLNRAEVVDVQIPGVVFQAMNGDPYIKLDFDPRQYAERLSVELGTEPPR